MVFSSYNSTSYLPLDNDQSVTFYKNENRLFPTAIVSPTVLALPPSGRPGSSSSTGGSTGQADRMSSMSTTDMLTAAYEQQQQPHHHHHHRDLIGSSAGSGSLLAGDCPFGRVQSPPAGTQQQQQQQPAQYHHHRLGGAVAMCDDFQPVAYLNGPSNGYYGYVPSLVSPAARGGAAAARHNIQHGNNHNNNNIDPEGTGNSRPLALPVAGSAGAARNVNGYHLSSVHYHGNGAGQPTPHISCSDSERNNNNNNSDGPFGGRGEPFSPGVPLHHRKRKDVSDFSANLHQQHRDEDMDTNAQLAAAEQHHSKRRKMEPEPAPMQGMAFPGQTNSPFAAHGARDPYHPEQQQQHEAIEMECQEQPHPHPSDPSIHPEQHPSAGGKYSSGDFHPHTQPGTQPEPYTTVIPAAGQHTAASKSKYFDSSRCMMSHMI